jgi:hypothetical protein
MAARRRKKRFSDIVAILFAAMLLGINLMVRDPQTAAPAPKGDNAFTVCLILMSLGVLVVLYGLHQGRKQFLPLLHAQLKRRLPSVRAMAPLPLPMAD